MKLKSLLGLLTLTLIAVSPACSQQNVSDENLKYVYLTFDDGPLNGSEKVNDAINYEKIPITVLLVGEHALQKPEDVELYRKNQYISIANHSYSHANDHYKKYYSNPQGVLQDFVKNMKLLKLEDKVARLPGRNMWRIDGRSRNDIESGIEAADLLAENGFSLFGWDLEWTHDPKTGEPIGSAEEIFKQIEEKLENEKLFTQSHIVLLCHDEMFQKNYEETELKKLIDLLKSRSDYKFVHLQDYP